MAKGPKLPSPEAYFKDPQTSVRVSGIELVRPSEETEAEQQAREKAFLEKLDALPGPGEPGWQAGPPETDNAKNQEFAGVHSATEESEVQWLPVDRLVISPWNARPSELDSEALQRLIVAISCTGGVQSPLHVYPEEGTDRFAIFDGQRRFRASVALNQKRLPCIVHERLPAGRLYALSFGLSATGEKPSALDNALMWRKLLEENVAACPTDIAELVGVSKSIVSRTLLFFELDPQVQERLQVSPDPRAQTVRCFVALMDIQREMGVDAVLAAVDLLETSQTPLSELKRKLKVQKRVRHIQEEEQRVLRNNGKIIGSLRQRESNLYLRLPLLEEDPELASRLVDALEQTIHKILEIEPKEPS